MGHCFQTVLEVGTLFKNAALSVGSDISTCLGAWGDCMHMERNMTFLLFLFQKGNSSSYWDVELEKK